jgi:hypothetical protein
MWVLSGGGILLDAFVETLQSMADRRSTDHRPEVLFHGEHRSLPLLSGGASKPTLVVLPFESLGSAPRLARCMQMYKLDGLAVEDSCHRLIDEIMKYVSKDVLEEDQNILRYGFEVKMRRARSLWGDGGLLHDESDLFRRESESISGSGFRDQICFFVEQERHVLAEARYTSFPAPPLEEFEVNGSTKVGLFKALMDYVHVASTSTQRPTNLVYMHIETPLGAYPHGFLNAVCARLFDFGQHAHPINAEVLVLASANEVKDLTLNLGGKERALLKRRSNAQRFFVAASPDDFAAHFPRSQFASQWALPYAPSTTNVQFSESTQYADQPSAIAAFSPVRLGAYRRSREIRSEQQINRL